MTTRKRPRQVAEGWVPTTHGPSAYNRGCRCDTCRTAASARNRDGGYGGAYQRRQYAKRVMVGGRWYAPLPPEDHGKPATYNVHGCRCVACTVAIREYQRRYRGTP